MSIPIPRDTTTVLPLIFKTTSGMIITGPATGGIVTAPELITAALSEDGQSIAVTPHEIAVGTFTLAYANGELTASAEIAIAPPVAATVEIGAPAPSA